MREKAIIDVGYKRLAEKKREHCPKCGSTRLPKGSPERAHRQCLDCGALILRRGLIYLTSSP
jgi:ribosomal protein L32